MPHCSKCNKGQARLNQPDNLCKDCYLEVNDEMMSASQLNTSLFSSQQLRPLGFQLGSFSSTVGNNLANQNLPNASRHMSPLLHQHMSSTQQSQSIEPSQFLASDTDFDINTPISAMTAGQMLALIQSQTKPLEMKVESIDQKLGKEITGLKTRINVLENEVLEEKQKNETLTQIVVEMQKSLNKIDSTDREKNLIISGLPEDEIEVDGVLLKDDLEKVGKMFNLIEIGGGPWNVERLGKPTTNGKTRIARVVFPDREMRDKVVERSTRLKDLGEPWKKVYLNRDKHPVYRVENNRLRRKMNEYRKKPEYQEDSKTRVKITKGELLVDGSVIDRNMFSSFQ